MQLEYTKQFDYFTKVWNAILTRLIHSNKEKNVSTNTVLPIEFFLDQLQQILCVFLNTIIEIKSAT